ncbi:MAG: HIT family protein [Thermoproteota archaeon]|nr:HIT family protein [Thermoproteota archaeon]
MADCILCNIVKGSAPASVVYTDEKVTAIMDIQPVNPGHVLVIPNMHAAYLSELDQETGGHLFKIAIRIAAAVRQSGVRCEGVNLLLADGQAAGQSVFHVHLHVVPRFVGDGFGLKFGPNYGRRPNREELDETAKKSEKRCVDRLRPKTAVRDKVNSKWNALLFGKKRSRNVFQNFVSV